MKCINCCNLMPVEHQKELTEQEGKIMFSNIYGKEVFFCYFCIGFLADREKKVFEEKQQLEIILRLLNGINDIRTKAVLEYILKSIGKI